jgi:hypothetical protein
MGFYDEMAEVASEILTEFKQDAEGALPVQLKRPAAPTQGGNSYDKPTQNAPTTITLNATVNNVESDKATSAFVDGETILGSDLVITFPALDATPVMTDTFVVNGKTLAAKKIVSVPPSGTPVVHKVIVSR